MAFFVWRVIPWWALDLFAFDMVSSACFELGNGSWKVNNLCIIGWALLSSGGLEFGRMQYHGHGLDVLTTSDSSCFM